LKNMFLFLVTIGIVSGLLGAVLASITVYLEYMRGDKADKRLAFKLAIKTGVVVLLFFTLLAAGIAVALAKILKY